MANPVPVFSILFALLISHPGMAQINSDSIFTSLRIGNEISSGYLIKSDDENIYLLSNGKENVIKQARIDAIRLYNKRWNYETDWFYNPERYRYILSQSAFSVPPHTLTYQNSDLLFNQLNYGSVNTWQ